MNLPADCLFTRTDEWLRRDGDLVTVGLTEYGANELGELVFTEITGEGGAVSPGASFGVVESVKAVAELISPVAGKIVAVNPEIIAEPTLVNESPYENGWLVRVRLESEALPGGLMNAAQYASYRQ